MPIVALILILIFAFLVNRQPKTVTHHYDANGKLTGSSESTDASYSWFGSGSFWKVIGIVFLIVLVLGCIFYAYLPEHLPFSR